MKNLHKIKFLTILIFFSCCENQISELESEKKVMSEILPSLIDSTCIDSRVMFNIPPKYGKIIIDKEGKYVKTDSTKATKEQKLKLLQWKKRALEIEKDTSKLIIAFDTKIAVNKENVEEDFAKHFSGAKVIKPKPEDNLEYYLDFGNIKFSNKFKLKNISEFHKGDKIWETTYDFNFSGVVFFTKIQFDRDKKFGILDGGFVCGEKCGQGFRIYIQKQNSKWIIDKVEPTWVA